MLPILKSRIVPSVTRFLDDDWSSLFDWNNQGFPNQSMTVPSTNVKKQIVNTLSKWRHLA